MVFPEEVDVANAGQIREELLSVINRGAAVLIADMTDTVSCDHAGVDAIGRVYQRALVSGTELRLVVGSEIVRRVLAMSGVDRVVSIYPFVAASLAAKKADTGPLLTLAERGGGQSRPDADVGVEVALLDCDGVIVWVNEAWQVFAVANDGDLSRAGTGVSYLDVCDAAGDDPATGEVAAAIRSALTGDLPAPLAIEVPCHSPSTERWFDMLIAARRGDNGRPLGATVTLSLARSEDRATPIRPERSGLARTARAGTGGHVLPGHGRPAPPTSPASHGRPHSRRAVARSCSNGSRTACTRSGSPCRTRPTSLPGRRRKPSPKPSGAWTPRSARSAMPRSPTRSGRSRRQILPSGIRYHHPRLPGRDLGP